MVRWQPDAVVELILKRMQSDSTPASFGDHLDVKLLGYCDEIKAFAITMHPKSWMCNPVGIVHGGICATMADQAMGLVAYGIYGGESIAPTVQMQIAFHRPLMPGRQVTLHVRPISVGKHHIHLSAEGFCEEGNVCFSASGTFYRT